MATSLAGFGRQNAYASVAASQTDSVVVAAATGKKIRVIALASQQGDTTASTVVLNTKGSGAGTAISPTFKGAANALLVLPVCASGWFQTTISEGLTVTTGAGSTTGITVIYEVVQ
jgi:hypothetical protein